MDCHARQESDSGHNVEQVMPVTSEATPSRCSLSFSGCLGVSVVVFLLLLNMGLPFIVAKGRPFTNTCPRRAWLDIDFPNAAMIISLLGTLVVQLPAAVWLICVASSPYLSQVAQYLVSLWLATWLRSTEMAVHCAQLIDLTQFVGALYFVSFTISQMLCVRLAHVRLTVLETSMMQDFHQRYLKGAIVFLAVIAGGLSIFAQLWSTEALPWTIHWLLGVLLVAYLCWILLLLWPFSFVLRLSSEAARAITGRRKAEAKLAHKTNRVEIVGMATTFFTLGSIWLHIATTPGL